MEATKCQKREEGKEQEQMRVRCCRGASRRSGSCQAMGVKGEEERARHEHLAGWRALPGTRVLLSQPFTSSIPRVRTARRHTVRWGRSRAWDGRGAAKTKEPCAAHSVGRAAHLALETHHLFRAASLAQGCGQER